jgi:DUF177 domain-containing protein
MTPVNPLRIPVADLLHRPGSAREVDVSGPVPDLANGVAEVPAGAPVRFEATFERVPDGIVVRGWIRARWEGSCSRCLASVGDVVAVHVDELFEPEPLEGETYRLDDDGLDLVPLVRDMLRLELPNAPLCRPDCAGLCSVCGADRNETACSCTTAEPDPRWAALRSLDL